MKVIHNINYSITEALIEKLKETFPDTLPMDPVTPQQIAYLQGQQSIIYHLQQLFEETLEEN
jgi:hypothetical protein